MRLTKKVKEQMIYLLEMAEGAAGIYMWDDEIEDFDYEEVLGEMYKRLKLN